MKTILFSLLFLSCQCLAARQVDEILAQIAQHNPQLRAIDKTAAAQKAEAATGNALGATAVSYSPFYAGGVHGVASSELVVSQDLDFPTHYAQRSRLARQQQAMAESTRLASRAELLHRARMLCLQLAYQQRLEKTLAAQHELTAQMAALFDKQLAEGACTVVDANRAHLELINETAALAECRTAVAMAQNELSMLNGGEAVKGEIDYPALPLPDSLDAMVACSLAQNPHLMAAQQAVTAAQQQHKIAHTAWLPALQVGYRRNTDLEQAVHGVLVGASFQLFGTRRNARAAKIRTEAAQEAEQALQAEALSQLQAAAIELAGLQRQLEAYNPALLAEQLKALKQSVNAGRLTATHYCREAREIHLMAQQRLALEHRCHALAAEMSKY